MAVTVSDIIQSYPTLDGRYEYQLLLSNGSQLVLDFDLEQTMGELNAVVAEITATPEGGGM